MANLSETIQVIWPNAVFTMDDVGLDNYATLNWLPENVDPKPTEVEIRARSAEADVIIAQRRRLGRQQQALRNAPDYLLRAIETLIQVSVEQHRVINDLRNTIVPAAHTGNFTAWNQAVIDEAIALRDRIEDIRNNVT